MTTISRGLKDGVRLLSIALLVFCSAAPGDAQPEPAVHEPGGVVTLYTYDDVRQTFGFTTAAYGRVARDGLIWNVNSQILFHGPDDRLGVTGNGGELGTIRDLGDIRDPGTQFSVFPSIVRAGDGFAVRADGYRVTLEPDALVLPAPTRAPVSVPATLGHVYLVRIDGVQVAGHGVEHGESVFVKLHVVDLTPGRSVTFRWVLL